MSTFYSVISATINPLTDESIALGLLLSDGKQSRYAFSSNRLSLVRSLVSSVQYKFIKDYLKSFQNIIRKLDKNAGEQTDMQDLKENLVVNEQYMSYMSIYSQNVVKVNSPVTIDLPVNETSFRKLFIKFIDKQDHSPRRERKSILQVKDDFAEKVKDHFTADRELPVDEFPNLELPVTVDLFGKNEKIIVVQFVDLERQINFIKTDLYDLEHIRSIAEEKVIFFVTNEPNTKNFPQQHYLWQQARKDSKYEYTDLKEIDRIKEYAREHGVIPN